MQAAGGDRLTGLQWGLSRAPWALPVAAGAALRLWMLGEFPQVDVDALLYGDLAKNLLLHGRYALTGGSGVLHESLIRLPGYPLFLAACFRLFGMENYYAAGCAQIALELLGCLLLAGFAGRIAGAGAALATLWLAALCPFTASYAGAPLTETLTLFAIALALWAAGRFDARPQWSSALWFTFAVSLAGMLRPDGALVAVALAPAMVAGLRGKACDKHPSEAKAHVELEEPIRGLKPVPFTPPAKLAVARMAAICVLLALLPFAAWTWRNWSVFHVFEPLAPRYANDPGEDSYPGWQRWVKTWCLDFVSTYDIYWSVPDGPIDLTKLPARVFDSPAQVSETAAIVRAYNDSGHELTPQVDARFARLAEERIQAHPVRFYLWLPLGRLADMWLRPRVENLPIDLDWWVYEHHNDETVFSWAYAGLNAVYLLLGAVGLCLRPKFWPWMLAYMVLRSALLTTVEAPEARYTLECFPMLFVLAGIALYWLLYVGLGSVLKVKAPFGRA